MDNGNDPHARIPFLKILMKNMIPTNSGLTLKYIRILVKIKLVVSILFML